TASLEWTRPHSSAVQRSVVPANVGSALATASDARRRNRRTLDLSATPRPGRPHGPSDPQEPGRGALHGAPDPAVHEGEGHPSQGGRRLQRRTAPAVPSPRRLAGQGTPSLLPDSPLAPQNGPGMTRSIRRDQPRCGWPKCKGGRLMMSVPSSCSLDAFTTATASFPEDRPRGLTTSAEVKLPSYAATHTRVAFVVCLSRRSSTSLGATFASVARVKRWIPTKCP